MREGIKGRLKDMALVDIIQVLHLSRRTAAINMGSDEGAGKVYVEQGNVIHARFRELSGESALYQLLSWKDGEFEVEMDIKAEERTISQNVEGLLLEGMKKIDESKRKVRSEKERLFNIDERESLHLIKKLTELGILCIKEG